MAKRVDKSQVPGVSLVWGYFEGTLHHLKRQHKGFHLILTLWRDFEPPLTSHHREEVHVSLPHDPEQFHWSDLVPTLSFTPHINSVVRF